MDERAAPQSTVWTTDCTISNIELYIYIIFCYFKISYAYPTSSKSSTVHQINPNEPPVQAQQLRDQENYISRRAHHITSPQYLFMTCSPHLHLPANNLPIYMSTTNHSSAGPAHVFPHPQPQLVDVPQKLRLLLFCPFRESRT